jgi:hypothetical protein
LARLQDLGTGDAVGHLRVGRLVEATVALVGGAWPRLWPIAALFAAVNVIGAFADLGAARAGLSPQILTASSWIQAALTALLTLAAVRTMLGAAHVWRPDRGGLVLAGMDFLGSLLIQGWYRLGDVLGQGGVAGVVAERLVWVAAGLAVWWLYIRSTLWIYGAGVREPGMTLRESWRRMRGAATAMVGASTLLAILPDQGAQLLTGLFDPPGGGLGRTALITVDALFSALFSLMIISVPAAAYRLRGGEAGDVAHVFD